MTTRPYTETLSDNLKHSLSVAMSGYHIERLRRHLPAACRAIGGQPYTGINREEIDEMDKIVLSEDITTTNEKLAMKLKDRAPLSKSHAPFIKSGCIIFPGEFCDTYIPFKTEGKRVYFECYALGDVYTQGKMRISFRGYISPGTGQLIYDVPEKIIYDASKKGKIKLTDQERKIAEWAVEQMDENSQHLAMQMLILWQLINTMLEAEDRQRDGGEGKPYSAVRRANTKKGRGTQVVFLDQVTIERGRDSLIKVHKGAIMNRYTDVWSVRGHIRHYKSGKEIWIEPYEKGPERGKKKPKAKEYRI